MTYDTIKSNKIVRAICDFQRSNAYIYVLAALALISNAFGLDGFSFVPVLILLCFTNLFSDSVLPALPAVFTIVFGISPEHTPAKGDISYYLSVPFLCCEAPLVCAVIATAVWRVIKDKNYTNIKFWRGLGFGVTLYGAGLLLGGMFTEGYAITDFAISLLVTATFVPFYFFFAATLKKCDLNKEYICRTMVVSGLVVVIELAVFYLKNYQFSVLLDTAWKAKIHVGWGISNTIGMYSAFMIPPCFYFALEKKQTLKAFILAGIFLFGSYFSLCRSGLLFGCIAFAACAVICCVYGQEKTACSICFATCLAVGCLFLAVTFNTPTLPSLMEFFKKLGFSDNGRFKIWENSLEIFTEHPVLGSGFCGYLRKFEDAKFFVSFSHNTIIQLLVACGIFGLLCYLYHRVQTIILFTHKITPFRGLIAVQILALLGMGMVDIAGITPYFNMVYAALLAFFEKESFELCSADSGFNLTPLSVIKRAKAKKA